jgi:hypothetical protein
MPKKKCSERNTDESVATPATQSATLNKRLLASAVPLRALNRVLGHERLTMSLYYRRVGTAQIENVLKRGQKSSKGAPI